MHFDSPRNKWILCDERHFTAISFTLTQTWDTVEVRCVSVSETDYCASSAGISKTDYCASNAGISETDLNAAMFCVRE